MTLILIALPPLGLWLASILTGRKLITDEGLGRVLARRGRHLPLYDDHRMNGRNVDALTQLFVEWSQSGGRLPSWEFLASKGC